MNVYDANILLTKATLLDPRLSRPAKERVEQAEAWASVLADVPLPVALDALADFYLHETKDSIRPAHIAAWMPAAASVSDAGNVTELRLAAERRAVSS